MPSDNGYLWNFCLLILFFFFLPFPFVKFLNFSNGLILYVVVQTYVEKMLTFSILTIELRARRRSSVCFGYFLFAL